MQLSDTSLLRQHCYIDGQWVGADSGATVEVTNPANGAVLGTVHGVVAAAFGLVDPRLGAPLLVYPLFVAGVAGTDVAVSRAYWWFPALNTLVGMLITLGGLWRLLYG